MNTQTATVPTTQDETRNNGHNYGGDKEMTGHFLLLHNNAPVVDLRLYYSKSKSASVCYASIWLHHGALWTSGKGRAGGYGYHRASQAAADAFASANVRLSQDIGGRGDSAITEALYAVAEALGLPRESVNVLSFE